MQPVESTHSSILVMKSPADSLISYLTVYDLTRLMYILDTTGTSTYIAHITVREWHRSHCVINHL